MMLHPQMSPDYSVENKEDFHKMAAGTVAPVSSVQGNGVNTEVQREPLARSPVTPPPSGPVQRTGRWTPDEKILFLYGLKRFGKGRWKRMSIFLPHRSLVQIKSHAQKVLKRLQAGENVFRRLEENYNIIEPLIAQAAQEHDVLAQFDEQGLVVNNSGRRPAKKFFFEEAPLSYSQLFGTQPPAPVATKPAPQQDGDVAALAASALCQLSSLPK